MANDQRRKSKVRRAEQLRDKSHNRPETRLVLPPAANPQATGSALKEVTAKWLLPTLLEDFLKERGICPKGRFCPKTQY